MKYGPQFLGLIFLYNECEPSHGLSWPINRMSVYKLDKLMEETRRLAAEYRKSTGSTLPVSAEIAKYDAMRLLGLVAPTETERAVDALRVSDMVVDKIQIKGRVVFDPNKSGYRVGQLNLDAAWDSTLMVLMNDQYQTEAIYELSRAQLEQAIPDQGLLKKNARGSMSINKFKAIGELLWSDGPAANP